LNDDDGDGEHSMVSWHDVAVLTVFILTVISFFSNDQFAHHELSLTLFLFIDATHHNAMQI